MSGAEGFLAAAQDEPVACWSLPDLVEAKEQRDYWQSEVERLEDEAAS